MGKYLDKIHQHVPVAKPVDSTAKATTPSVEHLLGRLRNGHVWLTETNNHLCEAIEVSKRLEERFLDMLDKWDNLDLELRRDHRFTACVTLEGKCPQDSPVSCRGCAGWP